MNQRPQVLLVEQNPDLGLLLSAALRATGVDVSLADSAEMTRGRSMGQFDLLAVGGETLVAELLGLIAEFRGGDRDRLVVLHAAPSIVGLARQLDGDLLVNEIIQRPADPNVFALRVKRLLDSKVSEDQLPSKTTRDDAADLELNRLEISFSERLPQKLDELARALTGAEDEPALLATARFLSHRLRGTIASYGYQDVSDMLETLEEVLQNIEAGDGRTSFQWERAQRVFRDAVRQAKLGPNVPRTLGRVDRRRRRPLLVVDDDVDFLRLVRSYARRHSLQVVSAETVEEALERASTMNPCAVLLDVHLANETSLHAAGRLREEVGNPELPIIFASIDGSLETRMMAVDAGGTRFLDKPLTEQRFSELLHQVPFAEPRPIRIVILDDDEIVLERYECELREAGSFVFGIQSPSQLLDALDDVRPDALLLDVNLGQMSGIDICRALRCSERWQFLPILMFSGDRDAAMRVRAFQSGASDVLGKPVSAEELLTRVSVQAERIQLMRERSDRDSLSGLMLRRAFVDAIQRSLAACVREKKQLALILFDLDHFKQINDSHGHLMGDRVIARFGELLKSRFRLEDLRGRWGGEEFVLAFPGQGAEFGVLAAERLLHEFSELAFETEGGVHFRASFTAGVSIFPEDGESLDLLIKRADEALYRGKEAGRRRVCLTRGAN